MEYGIIDLVIANLVLPIILYPFVEFWVLHPMAGHIFEGAKRDFPTVAGIGAIELAVTLASWLGIWNLVSSLFRRS